MLILKNTVSGLFPCLDPWFRIWFGLIDDESFDTCFNKTTS